MTAANLDSYDLGGMKIGGTIHEDLMDAIFDISPVDRPFCDAIGSTTSGNIFKEWVRESLSDADPDNASIDGADAGNHTVVASERLGNYHQQMQKTVKVSDRSRNVDSVGSSDELIRQLMKRQKELRRDEEAALTSRNAAVAGNGTDTAGKLCGVGSWIGVDVLDVDATTSDRGATTGADGLLTGNGAGGGGYVNTAAVSGTARALSEGTVKTMMEAAYMMGGNPTMMMSVPKAIQLFSDWLFSGSARVATLQTYADAGNRTDNGTGGGRSGGGIAAQGAVNIFVTNFGTLELVPNRFQPNSAANEADVYLIDPTSWERAYLQGYETNPLARTGTAENRQITVDVTLCALNPEANAVIADIDLTAAAVA